MSAEEFIYSVINADNVAQLDLNVIANTLASADSLIRQIKAQQVENESLKEKISSLRTSALQIKQLYEAEVGKNQGTVNREEDYIRQLKELEARATAAENVKVNAELRDKEMVAELERKLELSNERYNGLALDMVKNCTLLAENGLLPSDQQMKFRDLKCYVQTLIQSGQELPEDVISCLTKKKFSKKKRKPDGDYRDQATMTNVSSVISVGVNTIVVPSFLKNSSTSTQDLEANRKPFTADTTSRSLPQIESPRKTFADKSTMYSSSTITRSTCTSAFIKRVDVGVNYPEVIPKSINDILRECVVELPSLLSPILDELPVRTESIQTQTESSLGQVEQRPQMVTCGTNTTLRNVRRKVSYVRKTENLPASHVLSSIKKEEAISPAGSIQNIPAALYQSEELGCVSPQLSQIWGLLGDTMFRLLGVKRSFDNQGYNAINERLALINNLIDSEGKRGTDMMSEVFAAAAASAAMVSSSDEDGGKRVDGRRINSDSMPVGRGKCIGDYEEDAANEDDAESEQVPGDIFPEVETVNVLESMGHEAPIDACTMRSEHTGEMTAEPDANSSLSANCTDFSALQATVPVKDSLSESVNEAKETTCAILESSVTSEDANTTSSPELQLPADNSFPLIDKHAEESQDYALLMEPVDEPTKDNDQNQPNLPVLEDHDEIANELRLMEEGQCAVERTVPANFSVLNLSQISEKYYLNVNREEEIACTTDDESDRMMIVEKSPTRLSASSSCTSIGSNGTLISPIKVKETNELVKDQFKTPTSPAISKRKLRERLEGGCSKRGRLSPTTESLLEDDWDRKFTRIKHYFTLPSSLNPIEDSASKQRQEEEAGMDDFFEYSPVEDFPDDDEEASESQTPEEQHLMQPLRIETDIVPIAENAISESPESPVEEYSSIPVTQWNDFKVPLQVDIGNRLATTITSASDSPESPPLEDSPLSPTLEGQTDSIFACDDSPLSPPLEGRVSMYTEAAEAKVIPLEHVIASRLTNEYRNTPICKAIAKYNSSRRAEVLRKLSPQCINEAGLVKRVVRIINDYVKEEWTVENLNLRVEELMAVAKDTRIISLAVIDSAVSYGDFVLNMQCSPPAPPLPRIIQQLVLLVKTLNDSLYTLDKVILHEIDRKVFTLKSDTVRMETITAMTYLYIGVSDSNRLYGCTARLFIYKCLYYFNYKGLPLIYHVLKAFPHALPKKGSVHYDNSDAMVSTIRTILMNINYMERPNASDAHLYKKSELLKLLKYFYGYQPGMPTYEELITNLVEKVKASKLKNVDYCLILVAKRKGYDWAKDHIIQKHLYPLLNDYLKQMNPEGSLDDRICCLIFTISAILKTQPNFQDVSGFMQMFGSIVQMADGNPRVQEAAVAGLMRFTRFGFADIYEWLCKWCPSYQVSGRIKLMLATFVHRKEERFWQQLSKREIV